MVLGTAVEILAGGAGSNTHGIGVVVVSIELGLELTARVVLEETALVAVLAKAIAKQRRRLLRNSSAVELDNLLTHRRVVGVDSPNSSPVRGSDVPLALGGAASKNSSAALTGGQRSAFREVDLVGSLDETVDSKRRLGDSERELDTARGSPVGDTEFERARVVLGNIAKVKGCARDIFHPALSIDALELKHGLGSRAS